MIADGTHLSSFHSPRRLAASRSCACGRPRKSSRSWRRRCAKASKRTLPALPSKYFYDARGSALFERITTLPEYYPTRVEEAIHAGAVDDIVERARPREWVELGSGMGAKTRRLLDRIAARDEGLRSCILLDVDESALRTSLADPHRRLSGPARPRDRRRLPARHPRASAASGGRRMIGFLGGTIGNLHPDRVPAFFRAAASVLDPGDTFLLGRRSREGRGPAGGGVQRPRRRHRGVQPQPPARRSTRGWGPTSTSRRSSTWPSTTPPGNGSRCACGRPGRRPSTSRKPASSAPLPGETRSAPRSAASTRASGSRACSGYRAGGRGLVHGRGAPIRRNSAPPRQLGRAVRLS